MTTGQPLEKEISILKQEQIGDWEDTDYQITCPFCDDLILESTLEAFEHCADVHEFDFLTIKKQLSKSTGIKSKECGIGNLILG